MEQSNKKWINVLKLSKQLKNQEMINKYKIRILSFKDQCQQKW